jgi:monoterpene epsilon-lactone hydrolase
LAGDIFLFSHVIAGASMTDSQITQLRELLASRPLPPDLAATRAVVDADAENFPLDDSYRLEPLAATGLRGEWITPEGADEARVVLFLHGGGYVFGSSLSHRHLAAEIARAVGSRALSLDYRLAPEHPFPAAVDDALAGYRHLLEAGFSPGHIAIVGDSAGGGLAVATLVAIKLAGLPQPACGWVISPWVDLEALGSSYETHAMIDPSRRKASGPSPAFI